MTPRSCPNTHRTNLLLFAALFLLLLPLAPTHAQSHKKDSSSNSSTSTPEGWTIVLATYAGPDHAGLAASAAEQIRTLTPLKDVQTQNRGKGSVVVLGSYPSPADPQAQKDLLVVRNTLLEERPLFLAAFLAPPRTPSEADPGSAAPFPLSTARAEFSPYARYTLQIAIYESPNLDEARKAAEKAALQLRRDGEPAFYYHGPTASLVTLGAFTDADAGISKPIESPLLAQLRKRHPHNLYNGNQQLLQKTPGAKDKTPQPSFLVEIP